MKVTHERNPYLKRIYSQTPHKYSFDMDTGKHFLINEQGTASRINPNGTFRSSFRPNYSGFVNHKTRYLDAPQDPSVLHFAPQSNPTTSYHYPLPDKFAGYAQFPYQLSQVPAHLAKHGATPNYPKRKTQSLMLASKFKGASKDKSAILEYNTEKELQGNRTFFDSAWAAMTETKPLPKQVKKTCYNYKCKFLKRWTFDERGQMQREKAIDPASMSNTFNRSFHEGALNQEMQETKLLSTMAFTNIPT